MSNISFNTNTRSTIIDSGTTYSLFPQEFINIISSQVESIQNQTTFPATVHKDGEDYCFLIKEGMSERSLFKQLPKMYFSFDDNITIPWKAKYYLEKMRGKDTNKTYYCFGITPRKYLFSNLAQTRSL